MFCSSLATWKGLCIPNKISIQRIVFHAFRLLEVNLIRVIGNLKINIYIAGERQMSLLYSKPTWGYILFSPEGEKMLFVTDLALYARLNTPKL